ncbi:hypothetical protein KI387_036177, partial [Taxus chinensis]
VDDEDDYDDVVVEMNSESYVVMTQEQTNKKEKVVQPTKISKESPITIPVIARRGAPIPTTSTQKVSSASPSPSTSTSENSFPTNDKADRSKSPPTPSSDSPSTSGSFDIIDHLKKTKIQISEAEFYQTHPKAFAKM